MISKTWMLPVLACLSWSVAAPAGAQAFTENFDSVAALLGNGWFIKNNSNPLGTLSWFQGTPTTVMPNPGPFNAFNGANDAYVAANFRSTVNTGTISTWLLTPNRTLRNGDVFAFYTRRPAVPAGQTEFADRLELRRGSGTNVGTSETSVGDFGTLLLSINPTLALNVYPQTWTQFTVTISGLPAPTSGRLAFRYFVTNGGFTGTNSDYIGVDNVVYTPYVCPTLQLNPTSVPATNYLAPYSTTLSQSGALGTPSFAVTAGALPPGLTLSPGGTISGSSQAAGTFNFTVTVSDASGCSAARAYSIIVAASNQTIAFPVQAGRVFNPGSTFPIDPPALASSGLPVIYGSSTAGVCTVSGTTVTMVAAGECVLTADQPGDGGFNPAPQATRSVAIAPAPQVLTFPAQTVPSRGLAMGATFAIDPLASSASPNSNAPIVYSSLTLAVCTVAGTTVTVVAEGACRIAADQAGNANFMAAARVEVQVVLATASLADLSIDKSADRATALIGETVVYTLVVGNAGPAASADVRVVDVPPARLDPASVVWECVEATGTTCPTPANGNGTLDAAITTLPVGASVRFELMGRIDPAAVPADDFTVVVNTASVALPPGSPLTDPDPSDNQDAASVQVQAEAIFANSFEAL